ncbi:MAG: glycosyltransferase family 2 protein [Xanthobacteraceae bacterium]
MKLAHILICHSVDPARLFDSFSIAPGDLWIVFFHGRDEALCRSLAQRIQGPGRHFFPYRRNRGLARSWNEGVRLALAEGCDAVMMLNDDLHFHPGGYDAFVTAATSAVEQDGAAFFTTCGHEPGPHGSDRVVTQGFACCIIAAMLFEAIGGFDENFWPAYYEDCDFRYRLRSAGFAWLIDKRPLVHHARSSTLRTDERVRRRHPEEERRNKAYYVRKWGDVVGRETFATPFDDPRFDLRIPFARCRRPYGRGFDRGDVVGLQALVRRLWRGD